MDENYKITLSVQQMSTVLLALERLVNQYTEMSGDSAEIIVRRAIATQKAIKTQLCEGAFDD
jgi:hypothetical protein